MKRSEYVTEQKKTLLDFLEANKESDFTIDEIIELMAEAKDGEKERPGKSTVYRQMKKLLENGTVRRFESDRKKSFVYQFSGQSEQCDDHYHLKCVKCGRLYHVDCDFLNRAREHIEHEHGFIIGENKSILYGVCKKCK